MPHDPVRIAETKSWLVKAARDLRAADHEWSATPPLRDDIAFHCQQAVEKFLKAFLTWHVIALRADASKRQLRPRACGRPRA
jgi:HEPN domain-containing protein